MSTTYTFRSQALDAARHAGYENFRTYQDNDGMWHVGYEPGSPTAIEFLGRDYVSHVETDWDRTGSSPRRVGVLIVTCKLDEIPAEEIAQYDALGLRLEPLTPSLWDRGETAAAAPKRASTGTREKSTAVSPVKIVWRIADEMAGKSRAEVIAACVAEGVHKSTASTQFYRWQKAKTA